MTSPRAAWKPADSAAALPKLRRKRMPWTRGSCRANSLMIFHEPSVLPSSTSRTSRSSTSRRATPAISANSGNRLSASLNTGMTTEITRNSE